MKHLSTLLFFLISFQLSAQKIGQIFIDSLINQLPKCEEDTNKVLLLKNIAFAYSDVDPSLGISYGKQALDLASNLQWKAGIAKANNSIGANFANESDYANALLYFFNALKIFEEMNDKNGQARELGNIGYLYTYEHEYAKALDYNLKALDISRSLGEKKDVAIDLVNIGNIYHSERNYSSALNYYNEAAKIYDEAHDKSGLAEILGNMGNVYASQNDYRKALEYDLKGLNAAEGIGFDHGIAIGTENIGMVYFNLAKNSSQKQGYIKKASEYLNKAITIDKRINYLDGLKDVYWYLSELQSLSGNYRDANKNLQRYIFWKDSVFSRQNSDKIAALETQRQLDLKDNQIKLTKLDSEKNRLAFLKKRNENLFFIAGIVIIVGIAVFINYQRKKSDKLLLNILPESIANRLKSKEHPIADYFPDASVLFMDITQFTQFSENRDPKEIVGLLNNLFTKFDELAKKHGLEKIKTIGDSYMAVSGVPLRRADHVTKAADMALDVKEYMKVYKTEDGATVSIRTGLHCGPVIAGVIGSDKFIYDVWGDTVNTASRMELTGIADEVHCTDAFKKAAEGKYKFVSRGEIEVKGKGMMQTWILSA